MREGEKREGEREEISLFSDSLSALSLWLLLMG